MAAHHFDDQRRLVQRPAGRQRRFVLLVAVAVGVLRWLVALLDGGMGLDDTQRQRPLEGGLREADNPAAAQMFAEQEQEGRHPLRVGGQALRDEMEARRLRMVADQQLMARAVGEDFQDEGTLVRQADALDAAPDNRGVQFVGDGAHRQRIKHESSFPASRAY